MNNQATAPQLGVYQVELLANVHLHELQALINYWFKSQGWNIQRVQSVTTILYSAKDAH